MNPNSSFNRKTINPFWVRAQKRDNKSKKYFLFFLKWFKLVCYLFLTVMGLWGCFQIFFDHTISTPTTLGGGLEVCYDYGSHGYSYDCQSSMGSSNYAYYTFNDFTMGYGPFYGLFIWPASKFVMACMWATRDAGYGLNTLISIIFLLSLIRVITILISIRSIFQTEKMGEIQGKVSEINAKYKGLNDSASKQRKQMEISALYKKNNIKPFAVFEQVFVSLPISLIVYKIVTLTRPIKATVLFNIWDLSLQPFTQIFNNFTSGGWVFIFFLLIVIPTQILQQVITTRLAKKRNRAAQTISVAGAAQAKKTKTTQWIVTLVIAAFTAMVASGVGVYYFFNALFTIAQTVVIHKLIIRRRNRQKIRIEDISIRN